jgi:hypothetical protein
VYGPLQHEREKWDSMVLVGNLETERHKERCRKREMLKKRMRDTLLKM